MLLENRNENKCETSVQNIPNYDMACMTTAMVSATQNLISNESKESLIETSGTQISSADKYQALEIGATSTTAASAGENLKQNE